MGKYTLFVFLFGIMLYAQNGEEVTAKDKELLQQGLLSKAIFKQPSPAEGLVFDYGNVLSGEQVQALNQKLIAYNDSTSTQIVIVTIKDLNGFPLENTAANIGESWKVGQAEEDNGCVILLSRDDRKITIQGGYGFQAKMPATLSKIVIDQQITPKFKLGDYYGGLDSGTSAIFSVLAGEYEGKAQGNSSNEFPAFFVFALLFFLFIFLLTKKKSGGGKGGKRYRRSGWEDIIISGTGASSWDSGSSWSGGGSSSGGFGGFGGGSFGGGGASGSW